VQTLTVATEHRTQLLDVTAEVEAAVDGSDGALATLFVPHTTAGVVLQAAGPGATAVASDVEAAFERLVDEGWPWDHIHEGDRNPWSHVRAAARSTSRSSEQGAPAPPGVAEGRGMRSAQPVTGKSSPAPAQ
jgi:thiamine phosphate synthase YjbQ (UPF0047 family)